MKKLILPVLLFSAMFQGCFAADLGGSNFGGNRINVIHALGQQIENFEISLNRIEQKLQNPKIKEVIDLAKKIDEIGKNALQLQHEENIKQSQERAHKYRLETEQTRLQAEQTRLQAEERRKENIKYEQDSIAKREEEKRMKALNDQKLLQDRESSKRKEEIETKQAFDRQLNVENDERARKREEEIFNKKKAYDESQRATEQAHKEKQRKADEASAKNIEDIKKKALKERTKIERRAQEDALKIKKEMIGLETAQKKELVSHKQNEVMRMTLEMEKNHRDVLEAQQRRKIDEQKELTAQKWALLSQLLENKTALRNVTIGVSTIGTVALGAYFGWPIVWKNVEKTLLQPELVTDTSRITVKNFSLKKLFFTAKNRSLESVILAPELKERMRILAQYIKNTAKHNGVFQSILLVGPPGVGKTLWATLLAAEAGMDYAIISASAILQYDEKEAIEELKKLFTWARSNSKGTILFFDEFDALGGDRDLPENRSVVKILNHFLAETGTESKNFCMVFATNRPQVLDPAILTRVGERVYFTLPGKQELIAIMKQYIKRFITADPGLKKANIKVDATYLGQKGVLEAIADKFLGEKMSGRDTMYFINGLKAMVLAQDKLVITPQLLEKAVMQRIDKKHEENEYEVLKQQMLHGKPAPQVTVAVPAA